jgi:hypothetical protein
VAQVEKLLVALVDQVVEAQVDQVLREERQGQPIPEVGAVVVAMLLVLATEEVV